MKNVTIAILLLVFTSGKLLAQVGMMGNSASNDAILDLNNSDGSSMKGLLLPKVALTSTILAAPLSGHIAGMHVYNTATAGTGSTAVSPGEYYNNGILWLRVPASSWTLTGNANTNPAVNYLGTSDGNDLGIKTNNIEKMRISGANGNILVGTTTVPTGGNNAELILNNGTTNGAIQIKDGTQAAGNVLVSDVNGLGKWKKPVGFGSQVGQWRLNGTLNVTTSDLVESGTSTIVAGDQIGLTALSNGVKVPAGNYMVYITHDIFVPEYGYYRIKTNTGTVLFQTVYDDYLSGTAFYLTVPSGGYTLQSVYANANVNIPFYLPAPYTANFSELITFLKI